MREFEIVSPSERRAFENVLGLARFSCDDFILTETTAPAALRLSGDEISGWVTVKRGDRARTYTAGYGYDWISWFKHDIDFGIFGSP